MKCFSLALIIIEMQENIQLKIFRCWLMKRKFDVEKTILTVYKYLEQKRDFSTIFDNSKANSFANESKLSFLSLSSFSSSSVIIANRSQIAYTQFENVRPLFKLQLYALSLGHFCFFCWYFETMFIFLYNWFKLGMIFRTMWKHAHWTTLLALFMFCSHTMSK